MLVLGAAEEEEQLVETWYITLSTQTKLLCLYSLAKEMSVKIGHRQQYLQLYPHNELI